MYKPQGLGIYVWLPKQCEGGDYGAIAAKAKLVGVSWVAMQNFASASFVEAMHAAELGCLYSGYVKPSTTDEFVHNAEDVLALGADGLEIDAELEWELADDGRTPMGRHSEAVDFMCKLRGAVGQDTYVADAGAWALPRFHPNYPDSAFGQYVDAACPERYWVESTSPYQKWIAASEAEWQVTSKLYKSVTPIGSAYGTNGSVPAGHQALKADDLRDFLTRYPDKALWSWMHVPGFAWDVIRDVMTIAEVAQTALPTP